MMGFIAWYEGNLPGSTEPGNSIPKHQPHVTGSVLITLRKGVSPSSLTHALCPRQVEACGLLHLVPTSKQVPAGHGGTCL